MKDKKGQTVRTWRIGEEDPRGGARPAPRSPLLQKQGSSLSYELWAWRPGKQERQPLEGTGGGGHSKGKGFLSFTRSSFQSDVTSGLSL